MKHTITILLPTLALLLLGCERKLDNIITIENNVVTCYYCRGFGDEIITYQNDVLVSDYQSVRVFRHDEHSFELIQTIDLRKYSGVNCMVINNKTLAVGVSMASGTGVVFIYERSGDKWEIIQEITIGQHEDAFGWDIDIDGDYMVIGAPAHWDTFEGPSTQSGKIYIFNKTEEGWVMEAEFSAQIPRPDDAFGMKVAINQNLVLASSSSINVFKFDEKWGLLRSDTFSIQDMSHSRDTFLIIDGKNISRSFLLGADGSFSFIEVNFESDLTFDPIHSASHIGEISGSLSLVGISNVGYCYLMKLEDNQWIVNKKFELQYGQYSFKGLAFTDSHVVLGELADGMSYVYFVEY